MAEIDGQGEKYPERESWSSKFGYIFVLKYIVPVAIAGIMIAGLWQSFTE